MPVKPTKLFDVRQGDAAIDADATIYADATIIVYKNTASKNAVIDAFAKVGGYSPTAPDPANPNGIIPNPQSKRQFFNKELQAMINSRIVQAREMAAREAMPVIDTADLP